MWSSFACLKLTVISNKGIRSTAGPNFLAEQLSCAKILWIFHKLYILMLKSGVIVPKIVPDFFYRNRNRTGTFAQYFFRNRNRTGTSKTGWNKEPEPELSFLVIFHNKKGPRPKFTLCIFDFWIFTYKRTPFASISPLSGPLYIEYTSFFAQTTVRS